MELSIHRAARRVGLALLWLLGSLATAQAAPARLVIRPWPASAAHVLAGNISRAEYFVDADPGLGNGTAIAVATPGADLAGLTFTVNLSTLSNGFHRLSTRTQDVGGVWSLTNTKSFYYQPATTTATLANINKAEYFIDAEPGFGNGVDIPVAAPGTDVSGLGFVVNLTPLTAGFHRLSTRTRDANGVWSLTNTKSFYYQTTTTTPTLANITKAEYFIDAEPGRGNGFDIPVASPGTDVSGLAFVVNLAPLTNGFHRLSTRTRDANGVWSLTNNVSFYYLPASAVPGPPANITRIEYYLDTDPGFGSATNVPIAAPAPDVTNAGYAADLSVLSNGAHRLFIRSRDADGKWSLVSNSAFTKSGCSSAPNYAMGLPTASYSGTNTSGTLTSSASVAFNTDPAAPTTSNSPYYANTGTLQADLGTAQTISEVRVRLTSPGVTNTVTIQIQTAATTAGPFTTIDTYVAPLVANTPLLVARPLATSVSARVLRLQFQNANTSNLVVVSGAGVFNFQCVTPSITSVAPNTGPVGTSVTITGANLQGTSVITFAGTANNTVTSGYAVNAAGTQITGVVVPAGAITGNLSATTPNGTTNGVSFTVTTQPALTSIAPASGVVGSTVTLNGANLTGTSVITFAGSANNTVTSGFAVNAAGTQITGIVVPSGAATGNVTATTPGGTTNGVAFTVTLPAPTLTSLNPTSGPVGTSVTITGTNLSGATSVSFNGTAQTTIASNTATSLVVVVPAGATSGNVTVTTPNGTSNGLAFTVTIPAPVISSFSPAFAKSGQTVTVTGQNLSGATALSFSGVAQATFSVNAAGTQLTATVPYTGPSTSPDLPSGLIQVTTPSGTAASATALRLLAVTGATVTVGATAYPGGLTGDNVSIVGSGFTGATVAFVLNSVSYPVAFTVVSETQITAVVPDLSGVSALSGNGGFTVTNTPGLSGANFEVLSPVVSSLSPSSGPVGTTLTVTGFNFQRNDPRSGASVPTAITGLTIGGVAGTGFQLTSPTQAQMVVPNGAATGFVRTSGGTLQEAVSRGVTFTVSATAPPDLVVSTGTGASPVAVAAGTYNSITVTSTGVAQLSGSTVVNTSLAVSGTLLTNCQPLTGAASFTLAAGGTLGICDPAGIAGSGATGAVQTNGTRSFSADASYVYNGTAAQTTGTGLPGQVRALTTTNANAVTLSSPTSVAQVLTVGGAGNLVLNGQALTLLSSAAGTALAVNSGTGVVSGAATVQRYIDPSQNAGRGYRHYSAPVSSTTVADLTTVGFAPEVSQAAAYNGSATPGTTTPFPTVFGYDQSRVSLTNAYAPFDRGFVVPASLSSPLAVGQGYAVNIDAAQLVDFVGTLTTGDQALALARNAAASANATDAGWQLVGNPYPAPLDYSLVAPADRSGLDAGMYVFESSGPYTGTYRAYVNGFGGNSLIGSSQGFFVRVSSGQTGGALTFRNGQRVTSYATQVPVRRGAADPRPLVQLELRGASGPADALYAYAETGASPGFDPQYDAVKLPNTTGLNLASVASTGEGLAIDGRAAFSPATVLPLTVGVPAAGTYSLAAAALRNLPAGLDAWLVDALTGQMVNLTQQPRYAFAVTAAQAATLITGRFSVVFRAGALAAATGLTATAVTLYPNPAHDAFTVLVPGVAGAMALQAELLNALGQVVLRQTAALPAAGVQLRVPTAELAQGVYLLRLQAGESIVSKRVIVQ